MAVFLLLFVFAFFTTNDAVACQDSFVPNRLIYLGDSHTVGTFGQRLASKLAAHYPTTAIKRYGVVGASASHWSKKDNFLLRKLKYGYFCDGDGTKHGAVPANFPTATQLFQSSSPESVVVALGTNDVKAGCRIADKEEQMAAAKALISQIHPSSKCVWVGPTEQPSDGPIGQYCGQEKIKSFIDNLKSTVSSRCTFVDSRKIFYQGKAILPNRKDKLHYDGDLANYWAERVAKEMGILQTKANNNH